MLAAEERSFDSNQGSPMENGIGRTVEMVSPKKEEIGNLEKGTGSHLVSTPIASPKTMNDLTLSEKNSPNLLQGVTQNMVEEEEKYKIENQQMDEVRTQALEELARTGQQERFERLQSLLNKSEAYTTYLLGRVNARREEEEKRVAAEKKKKANDTGLLKDIKPHVLDQQKTRSTRESKANTTLDIVPQKRKRKDDSGSSNTKENKKQRVKGKLIMGPESQEYFEDPVNTASSPSTGILKDKLPEQQPKLLTGGVLRNYQIQGMEWLVGLYENGINGILADEMGLGKTLQSIALICKLIEQKVIGPFMIAAPLSTLPNWMTEFKKFAPEVYTILYHGSKVERFEKRRKMMRVKKYKHGLASLPVVISSYEILMRDRLPLSTFGVQWKYLIVDEGHRLKNLNCKLIKELKQYDTANRLLLTGTPLQNNLSELWSLLNFLLPDIFDDLASFQQWFDFSALSSSDFIADEHESKVLQTLHSILNPFLLRRLKTDVDLSIPPKKEVLVYCPMTEQQQSYYRATLDRSILDMIQRTDKEEKIVELTATGRPMRKSVKDMDYALYEDNDKDFESWVKHIVEKENKKMEKEMAKTVKEDKKAILNIRLTNVLMLLRKCCNHPYLLEYPYDSKTDELIIDDRLLKCSGKLLMLDRMLPALLEDGHKMLIFSQMTTMMDIIGDYLNLKKLKFSRLDGSMNVDDRRINIENFDKDPKTSIFLLSTRAGGLGLNLMSADTCIIYDSDWNPQVDLQAQDRCHRIGQKKPVVIYRFTSANTVDQKILERAATKRKLEKMVVHDKRFKGKAVAKALSPSELMELLESSDVSSTFNTDNVITDEQLDALLDRSDLYKLMEKKGSQEEIKKEIKKENNDDQPPTNKLFTIVESCISDKVII